MPRKRSAPKLAMIVALVLLLATTTLAAAQSPDILLPLVTGGQPQQIAPDMPEEEEPPLLEPDPAAPIGDSTDTNSGDSYQAPAETAAIDAFDATQWTVQNNVGIGTDAPTEPLDISRNVNNYTRLLVRNPHPGNIAQAQLYLNTAGSTGLVVQQFGSGFSATWNGLSLRNIARLRTTPTAKGLILTTGGAYPLIVGTSDTERLRITPDGKVGIGTTTPAHRLSIGSGPAWTANSWSGAVDLTNGSAIGWQANSYGYSSGIGHTNTGLYIFHTLANPGTTTLSAFADLVINNAGNVGIGTQDPSTKLHVVGGFRLDGPLTVFDDNIAVNGGNLYVNSGDIYVGGQKMIVPDYVFEPEYPLMALDELRTYLAEDKHLPNVPDAEQIAQGGLNVSEFQMKLLEKTEELTLYTLAQDEQIERLQQENEAKDEQLAAMQQMMADLEARLAALEAQAP